MVLKCHTPNTSFRVGNIQKEKAIWSGGSFFQDNYTQRVCRRVCRHVCRQVYRQLGPRFSNILSYLESSRMFWNVLKCSECSRMFQNVLYVVNSQCFKLLQIFFVQFFLFVGSRGYGRGGGIYRAIGAHILFKNTEYR